MHTMYTQTVRALSAAATLLAVFPGRTFAAPDAKTAAPKKEAAAAQSKPQTAAPKAAAPAPASAPAAPPAPAPMKAQPPAAANTSVLTPINPVPVRLEEVEVSEARVTALTQAPTESNLDVYQPQSALNLQFISNYLAPTADYSTIANLSPSMSHISTNGPGLSDARRVTLRGFNDGQYNVTYDGIPFADTNDFTHHTSSQIPAKMIGRVVVDRGPGTASTIGEATFGGTIAISSKDPRSDMAFIPTLSYGSYNTFLGHIEGNSGVIDALNGASAIASYQHLKTDGFQTNNRVTRDTTYVKYIQPIGKNTTVTLLSNYNSIKFNNPVPLSQAQIDTLGRDFGLNNDPASTLYWGYNRRSNQTDFEYIGIDTTLATAWHFSDKVYTYYYNNGSYDTASIGTRAWNLGDVIGRFKRSQYRAWGNTFNVSWDNPFGVLKLGNWYEYHRAVRYQFGLDYTKGRVLDYNPAIGPSNAFFYNMVTYLFTNQTFAEYDWRISKELTLNAGVKHIHFRRKLDALVNQSTRTSLYYEKTSSKNVGSAGVNYSLANDWTVYSQIAQGYLAPNLNQFYVLNPNLNQINAQQTVNYQVGTVYKNDHFNGDVDAYWIDYRNYPHSTTDLSTGQTIVAMADGARFNGVEAQMTYLLGHGTSLYANGSINHGEYKKSHLDVDLSPRETAALGLLYDKSGIFGSLIGKYVGSSKVYYSSLSTGFDPNNAASVTTTGISGGYTLVDFALGYGVKLNRSGFRSVKVKLEINNLLDRKVQVLDSFNGSGVRLFDVLPDRNYFLTVSAEF